MPGQRASVASTANRTAQLVATFFFLSLFGCLSTLVLRLFLAIMIFTFHTFYGDELPDLDRRYMSSYDAMLMTSTTRNTCQSGQLDFDAMMKGLMMMWMDGNTPLVLD
jgi:hypothetical protein